MAKTARKPTKYSKAHAQIHQMFKELQHRLRLDDWDITLNIQPLSELHSSSVGDCRWDLRNMKAIINVLEPEQNHYDPVFADIRLTLAHELIHVVLNPLWDNTKSDLEDDMREQAVERLARALVGV